MSYKTQIDRDHLPQHIAIIMDGNGRWAKQQGKNRVFGHQAGIQAVRRITEACAEIGIKFLTLYTFSTENWGRPSLEVSALMELLALTLGRELAELQRNGIKICAIGNLQQLPTRVRRELEAAIEATQYNTRLTLTLALSYSARWEIVQAANKLAERVAKGEISPEQIDEQQFAQALTTADMPDPELLIRTSGELRISNFMLWQIAYTELFFSSVLWPDFGEEHIFEAIVSYQQRDRRFGKVK